MQSMLAVEGACSARHPRLDCRDGLVDGGCKISFPCASGLTNIIGQKRTYLETLPKENLINLLLHSTIRHPELPLFPENIEDLIPDHPPQICAQRHRSPPGNRPAPSSASAAKPEGATQQGVATNGTSHTPRSQLLAAAPSDVDPAEAQLLGEFSSRPQTSHGDSDRDADGLGEEDDDYDTDPPAHYPKPGQGLMRTLPPDVDGMQWMVDDNSEVYSHHWRGEDSSVAPQSAHGHAGLHRNGNGDSKNS